MTEIGELVGIILPGLTGDPEEKEPKATLRARWSRTGVNPDYNRRWPPKSPPLSKGDEPSSTKARMLVRTRHVPDGTKASITVHHCHTGAKVEDGDITGLEVKGNRVIDPKTGRAPEFIFEAKHKPWDPWDKPFFYFKVEVQHQGLKGETPKDYRKKRGKVLRVRYWHASVADAIADTPAGGNLTTRSEMNEIAQLLRLSHHRVYRRAFNQQNVPVNLWGSVLRNTYAYHHASHGDIYNFGTNQSLNVQPNPPTNAVGSWRSTVVLGNTWFGAAQVNQAGNVPSVPRYLVYMDCCVAGWEPTLGQAFLGRGTQNYLAFRMYIPDRDARAMARKFYRKWARVHKCDPSKIAPVFWDVGAPYYNSMRPVLMGTGGGQISQSRRVNRMNKAIGGLVASIGQILKGR